MWCKTPALKSDGENTSPLWCVPLTPWQVSGKRPCFVWVPSWGALCEAPASLGRSKSPLRHFPWAAVTLAIAHKQGNLALNKICSCSGGWSVCFWAESPWLPLSGRQKREFVPAQKGVFFCALASSSVLWGRGEQIPHAPGLVRSKDLGRCPTPALRHETRQHFGVWGRQWASACKECNWIVPKASKGGGGTEMLTFSLMPRPRKTSLSLHIHNTRFSEAGNAAIRVHASGSAPASPCATRKENAACFRRQTCRPAWCQGFRNQCLERAGDGLRTRRDKRCCHKTYPLRWPFKTYPLRWPFKTYPLRWPFKTYPLRWPFALHPREHGYHALAWCEEEHNVCVCTPE